MRAISILLIAGSAAALAACGTHSSVRAAALAKGAQPVSQGRIYNTQTDYNRQRQSASPASSRADGGPAPLIPVAQEIQRSNVKQVPTYVASNEAAQYPSRASGGYVTVQAGDTVYALARRTGASPQAIIAENRLLPPYALQLGETLRVPDPEQKISNSIAAPAATPVRATVAANRMHQVRPGDTLYSISRSTGAPVAVIAQANRLRAPYALKVGDQLLVPGARAETAVPIEREVRAPAQDVAEIARTVSYTQPERNPATMFAWPVKGAIIGAYGAGAMGRRNDGVNIAAPIGTPVRAAADGEVVYRGSELDGYGNLLLVKHAGGFVTAYAHNDAMLVKKGDLVRQGQVIAKVGQTGAATQPQLHFEIRQDLKSVDPLAFLQN